MNYFFWLLYLALGAAFAASHHTEHFLKGLSADGHKSEKIYQAFCANCHAEKPLIPVGAPSIADKQAWDLRLKHGEEKMREHLFLGHGLMPARGGCFECSDNDLLEVLAYMLSNKTK